MVCVGLECQDGGGARQGHGSDIIRKTATIGSDPVDIPIYPIPPIPPAASCFQAAKDPACLFLIAYRGKFISATIRPACGQSPLLLVRSAPREAAT